MKFDLNKSIEILTNTPCVLSELLFGLSPEWLNGHEGKDTWSPNEVIGHLLSLEKNNWISRVKVILNNINIRDRKLETVDRVAFKKETQGKCLKAMLEEFEKVRAKNIELLKKLIKDKQDLALTGVHPEFGEITMAQLLSTWVVHDLTHISQIIRVMAKQYKEQVGPWKEYLRIVQD